MGDHTGGAGRISAGRATKTSNTAEPLPNWQPSMSRATADKWAANSAIKTDTYHVTSANLEQAIRTNGFDLTQRKFGNLWGDGVYVGTDNDTAALYQKSLGDNTRTLNVRLNIHQPFIFREPTNTGFNHQTITDAIADTKGVSRKQMWQNFKRSNNSLSTLLKKQGFDALQIIQAGKPNNSIGGNQIVVFDPKQVTILND